MFSAGDRVGVAVSGGADSVALLRLLERLAGQLGVRLAVLHFNHQLRGAESEGDERFVAELAAGFSLEFFPGRQDVAGTARRQGWNLEDAARRLRYAFFSAAAEQHRLARIAVAHTADDQAETVLARLVRGTGPAGLAAIYPVRDHVVRPLLEVRRDELRGYLEALGQRWREDATNLDTTRLRARLRHQILPMLERELQPAIVPHLCRLAEMAREDEAFWGILVAGRLAALSRREGARLGIRCADLLAPPPEAGSQTSEDARLALARRLVRGLFESVRGDRRRFAARHVEQVLHLATENLSGHRIALPGVVVERSFEWIWFEPAPAAAVTSEAVAESNETRASGGGFFLRRLDLGSVGETTIVVVPEIRRRFRLKVIDWPAGPSETSEEWGVLDRDLLRSPLVLRNWRPGDSFRPQGRRHAYKLKRFLRENRVAMRDRAGWPVLTSAENVAWVRGLPVAEKFALRESTRAGVVVAEEEL